MTEKNPTQEITIPKEVIQEKEISYTQAKKLMKEAKRKEKGPYQMSDKQKANIERLVALNKQKREAKIQEQTKKTEEVKQAMEAKTVKVAVKPKRVVKKKPIVIEESESEESEEEVPQVVIVKKKRVPKVEKVVEAPHKEEEEIKKKVEMVQQIDNVLKRRDPNEALRNMIRGSLFRY